MTKSDVSRAVGVAESALIYARGWQPQADDITRHDIRLPPDHPLAPDGGRIRYVARADGTHAYDYGE